LAGGRLSFESEFLDLSQEKKKKRTLFPEPTHARVFRLLNEIQVVLSVPLTKQSMSHSAKKTRSRTSFPVPFLAGED
jgi:hypothetical protein